MIFNRKSKIKSDRYINAEIAPDEIFMDSRNIPRFDTQQFEGRLERPIGRFSLIIILFSFLIIILSFTTKVWLLQIKDGEKYSIRSENNRLRHTPIFASRGVIFDRNGIELAWNSPGDNPDITVRKYKDAVGLSHVLGYVQYPSKDSSGFYYREDFEGVDGIEKYFNENLSGRNGIRLLEVDAHGRTQSQNTMEAPKQGDNIQLSIDWRIQSEIYKSIRSNAEKAGFIGGAGIIMDITNGEVIAMTSYPEYNSQVLSDKTDIKMIREYLEGKNKPFLDRVIDGLYTPGSIIKPYIALAALNEGTINPQKRILSTGSISVQNQYYPDLQNVFRDWKAHGYTDMREAIAVSSDVYFYAIGGGYKDQKGLGINRIEKYLKMFDFGEKTENSFFTGASGIVPNPLWKAKNFDGEAWNLGNTYHMSIGQYGFQVSPLQIAKALGIMANNGIGRNPSIIKGELGKIMDNINIKAENFKVIQEGMRLSVKNGTGLLLNVPYIEIAAKSGTAEIGITKRSIHSWMTGYFPYSNPRYAFVILLESGPSDNSIGASTVTRQIFDWMNVNTPEYFK